MASRTEILAAIAAGALALVLTGCGASAPETSASGAAAETVASVAPSAPATEAPADPPAAPSCDTVFTEAEYARLAEDGLGLKEDPYLLGPVMERMEAEGALICVWTKPNSDVSVWYARLEVGDQGQAWLDQLQAEGWLEDTHQGDGSYQAPADYDANYQPSVMLESGVLHFASYNAILREVLELQ
ncbi:hypothetical protein BJY17_002364 [Agromyces hippuratus]|uniref:DUF3558 domain-containing protein n=1 Tax=Agromyces hippuratus TaxID=286438 RepID=A0A852WVE1_9MICO|nr:hypothetical protein [Agromyces hippuratus]NYG21617.1 hypothetical protein [Agromyces hippuratus]